MNALIRLKSATVFWFISVDRLGPGSRKLVTTGYEFTMTVSELEKLEIALVKTIYYRI